MQSEETKKIRIIVWDCEGKKLLYDEQADSVICGLVKNDEGLRTIFTGRGSILQKLIAVNGLIAACRKIRRQLKWEAMKDAE